MSFNVIHQYLSNLTESWHGLTTSTQALVVTGLLTLTYCTSKVYANKGAIVAQIFLNLPEKIRFAIVDKLVSPGTIIDANIYPYALWMLYRIPPDNIDNIQQLLPPGLTIMKHKIFANDKKEDYYLSYNIYMSAFNDMESLRIELDVIAKNKENKGCWVVIDYYTDAIRMDCIAPILAPNCEKKYFNIKDVNVEGNKKEISAGIYIQNQEKKHDLFDFILEVDLNDKALVAHKHWITANDEMYSGGEHKKISDGFGWIFHAQFDRKEHLNYLNCKVKRAVNNLFTGIRGEFVTCFVIPNEQNYKLTIATPQ